MRATLTKALAALAASTVVSAAPSSSSSSSSPGADDQPACKPLLSDFDALGAWFEGVAAINATTDPADLARARNATVAIVGAGVAGLATALMLESVGLRGWELIEAGPRVGGRLRTVFVGGTGEWAEMGPMRLPRRLTFASDNATLEYSDHAMVWQLADALNARNAAAGRDDLRVDFIPWIQHSPNELLALGTGRLAKGTGGGGVPTRAEVAADASGALAGPAPLDTDEYRAVKARMDAILRDEETLRSIVRDPWRAHRRAMDRGLDDVSQQGMMRNAWGASEQVVDAIRTSTDYDVFWDEMTHNANLAQDGGRAAAGLTEWWCVDRGFSRIGEAFLPLVRDRLVLNRQVRSIEAVPSSSSSGGPDKHHNVTRLSWVDSAPADRANQSTAAPAADGSQSRDYDYTVVSAPFTMTRMMTALPPFSPQLTRAISERGLRFKDACKVALLFRERFWERGDRPILGGKSEPADAAMGALYYPVYGLNETGPRPGLIVQYRGGDWSSRFSSLTPDEHAARALDSVASLHGEQARDHYAGVYERLCWLDEPSIGTSWARPDVAQHRAYIPAYHATEHRTIFIGEHTAPTHAWVSSSLHSAARGTVQLLLEMGLVDEAKRVNREWMGRWL